MPRNFDAGLFRSLLLAAGQEARRRGDRRVGTEHLLLGLLQGQDSPAATALGVSLGDVRARADALDAAALSAIGVEVESLAPITSPKSARHLPPLTSGARAVLRQAFGSAKPRRRGHLSPAHFLLALLELRAPDPAAVLLDELGIDRASLAERLGRPGEGEVT